jgi:hypothetical protein
MLFPWMNVITASTITCVSNYSALEVIGAYYETIFASIA